MARGGGPRRTCERDLSRAHVRGATASVFRHGRNRREHEPARACDRRTLRAPRAAAEVARRFFNALVRGECSLRRPPRRLLRPGPSLRLPACSFSLPASRPEPPSARDGRPSEASNGRPRASRAPDAKLAPRYPLAAPLYPRAAPLSPLLAPRSAVARPVSPRTARRGGLPAPFREGLGRSFPCQVALAAAVPRFA